jgi:hypothetical protein
MKRWFSWEGRAEHLPLNRPGARRRTRDATRGSPPTCPHLSSSPLRGGPTKGPPTCPRGITPVSPLLVGQTEASPLFASRVPHQASRPTSSLLSSSPPFWPRRGAWLGPSCAPPSSPRRSAVRRCAGARSSVPDERAHGAMPLDDLRARVPCAPHATARRMAGAELAWSCSGYACSPSFPACAAPSHRPAAPSRARWRSPAWTTAHRASLHERDVSPRARTHRPGWKETSLPGRPGARV